MGSIPRSRQQIYDTRHLPKPTSSTVRATQGSFAGCLRASKEQEKDFIRLCQAHPEKLYVLYDERQINHLAQFCTSPIQNSLMSIDPTFDFGKFAVTPITTHHLMLKSQKTGNHPIMLGPVMIHHRKTYKKHYTLASRVAAANPKLKDVKGIAMDGEEPLQNSFLHIFSNAQPLQDFRHFRQNMDNALKDLGISAKKDRTSFLSDVFGYAENDVYIKELCDSDNEAEFRVMLDSFRPLWKDRETLLIGGTSEKVYNWISTRGEVIFKTMVREPREEAGLGNPPRKAYSNMSEAVNHILSVCCPGPQPVISFVEADSYFA